MLFDRPPSELPIATLRRPLNDHRGATVLGLDRGLANLGAWLRPRRIPLLVAFASLFAMLGMLESITGRPAGGGLHVAASGSPSRGPIEAAIGTRDEFVVSPPTREPVRFLLRPLAPGEHITVLTLVTLDPP